MQKHIEKLEKRRFYEKFLFAAFDLEYVQRRGSVFPYTSKCRSQCSESFLTLSLKPTVKAGLRGGGIEIIVDKKNKLDVIFFVFFISLLIVAQHVSDKHVPIIRS